MSRTQTDSDMEWKFARTKLWMAYIDESSTLPVPLNMIPTRKTCRDVFNFVSDVICRHNNEDDIRTETFVCDSVVSHSRHQRLLHFVVVVYHGGRAGEVRGWRGLG